MTDAGGGMLVAGMGESGRPDALLRQRNSNDPILPLLGIRGAPNQREFFDCLANGQILRHQKHARAGTVSLKEVAKVPRHGLEIVRDENAMQPGEK